MLSIAAMGRGSVRYYIELAREDYYLKGGEPLGLWLGTGADKLGLAGRVGESDFKNLFWGYSQDGSQELVRNAGRLKKDGSAAHHPGWDLTFSAPKAVSVLWSQAGEELRSEIQKAHHNAVKDAIAYLERKATITKRGHAGEEREPAKGLVVATFEHGTSRSQDPQLHTHALVMNLAPREDGTWGTIIGRNLFLEKMNAGAMYRATLAARLHLELGLEITPLRWGFGIRGVPKSLIDLFSKRRKDIEEELRALGKTDAKSAAKAAILTRERKAHVPRAELFSRWQEEAKVVGFTARDVSRIQGRSKDANEIARAELLRLRHEEGVFTERLALREVVEKCVGEGIDGPRAERAATHELNQMEMISLLGWLDGSPTYLSAMNFPGRAALQKLHELRTRGARAISDRELDRALKTMGTDGTLTAQQSAVLERVLQTRGLVRTLDGLDGLERMRALQAARIAWENKGYRVYAVSPHSADVRSLRQWTRIKAFRPRRMKELITRPKSSRDTLMIMASLGKRGIHFAPNLYGLKWFLKYAEKVRRSPWITIDKNTVIIVDSPDSMNASELAPILERVRSARGTVVLAANENTSGPHEVSRDISRSARGHHAMEKSR